MLYHRFGAELEIVGNCGVQPIGDSIHAFTLSLVYVKLNNGSNRNKFMWAETLRADNGIDEIQSAIAHAPKMELTGDELTAAIKQADNS